MPNWCYVEYRIVGEPENLKKLNDTLEKIQSKSKYSTIWEGDVFAEFGIDVEKENINCRGHIENWGFLNGDNVMYMNLTCAWAEVSDFRYFINEKFDVDTYYYQEEPGMEIYGTNDEEGIFFNNKYIIETESESEYIETDEELIDYVKWYFEIPESIDMSIDDVFNFVNNYNEKHDDSYFGLNEIEYFDD